ncbi:MAG TPA: hypothetical protein VHX65_20030 [Pirellulales bacterium]|jgi:transposase-like protein|nr:hypothetical protein [Pirellulales bacterium]
MAQAHGRRGQRDPGRERFWREALAQFGGSGLSVREFCRREKLGEPLFYAWRRTIAERDAAPSSENPATSRPAARRATAKGDRATVRSPSGGPALAPFLPVVMADEPRRLGGRLLVAHSAVSAGCDG